MSQELVLACFLAFGWISVPTLGGDQEDLDSAVSLAISGEYEEALRLFRRELAEHPDSSLLHYYVGMTEYRLGRNEIARVHLSAAASRQAKFPQAYFWLARLLLDLSRNEEAETIVLLGLERFPRNKDLRDLAKPLGIAAPELSEEPQDG